MDITELDEIGFLKYQGEEVPKGVIDAASAGAALTGLDEAIRFFNERQNPQYAKTEYQIPVKITEGSWIAYVLGALGVTATAFAMGYAKKTGEKLAENDIGEKTTGDILKQSVAAIQSLIRLVTHTKRNKDWISKNVQWRDNNEIIGIPKFSAFSFFDGPILSPARTKVVFLLIELTFFPPCFSISCFNSFLL